MGHYGAPLFPNTNDLINLSLRTVTQESLTYLQSILDFKGEKNQKITFWKKLETEHMEPDKMLWLLNFDMAAVSFVVSLALVCALWLGILKVINEWRSFFCHCSKWVSYPPVSKSLWRSVYKQLTCLGLQNKPSTFLTLLVSRSDGYFFQPFDRFWFQPLVLTYVAWFFFFWVFLLSI